MISAMLYLQSNPVTDTSALEARHGKDIQGIPWERFNFTRENYRETRLKQYKNYESLSRSREELKKVWFYCGSLGVVLVKLFLEVQWMLFYSKVFNYKKKYFVT